MTEGGPSPIEPSGLEDGEAVWPVALPSMFSSPGAAVRRAYLDDPAARTLVEFFEAKGLAALKEEDRQERWYDDWIACQARNHVYARLLSPQRYSTIGGQLDLLRLTRFLELFGYHSPAHGYSLQVTFLGFVAILMGENEALKREAVAELEAGGLLAFGVSEQAHGSDLLANEFTVTPADGDRYIANGRKYYIGNSNSARIIAVLARKESQLAGGRPKRSPPVLFALRPQESPAYQDVRKIRTLGVRSAYVGELAVNGHAFPRSDVIAEGRGAWDAVLGTVTLGKFLLGFGSIGICQRALAEAVAHLKARVLYGRPVIEMPHIRAKAAHAYARLAAMKLFAYRALDYVYAASAADRRYLLFNAVQKAKVSTEGVKVVALLSECVGAKGFESDTYFEMALRDVQLIPGLEGSAHINLALAAQFAPRYFAGEPALDLAEPASSIAGEVQAGENPYLLEARSSGIEGIRFRPVANAFEPLGSIANVRLLATQASAFERLFREFHLSELAPRDSEAGLALGQCLATIAYAQLIAENASRLNVPPPLVSAMFHEIVIDLGVATTAFLSACPTLGRSARALGRRIVRIPRTSAAEWDWVSNRVGS